MAVTILINTVQAVRAEIEQSAGTDNSSPAMYQYRLQYFKCGILISYRINSGGMSSSHRRVYKRTGIAENSRGIGWNARSRGIGRRREIVVVLVSSTAATSTLPMPMPMPEASLPARQLWEIYLDLLSLTTSSRNRCKQALSKEIILEVW
jgi:hypothetical protein